MTSSVGALLYKPGLEGDVVTEMGSQIAMQK